MTVDPEFGLGPVSGTPSLVPPARLTARWAAARVIYAVLAALLALRAGQAAWQLARWDFVEQGWNVLATWALLGVVLAGLSAAVLRACWCWPSGPPGGDGRRPASC